jgi:UDP-N-acetylglucosamine 2-epimerase (non-hydrolysing)
MHRPSNVDDSAELARILSVLNEIASDIQIIFRVHPRTAQVLRELQLGDFSPNLNLIDPLGYLEFLKLQRHASLLITDSGGIQEETTFLGVPCLTVRENTERPITVTVGTNILVGNNMERLKLEARNILSGNGKKRSVPPLWDGKAGERVVDILASI